VEGREAESEVFDDVDIVVVLVRMSMWLRNLVIHDIGVVEPSIDMFETLCHCRSSSVKMM
jgi:hypothetical protein